MSRVEQIPTPCHASHAAGQEPAPMLDDDALERLMPMHILVGSDGRIRKAARTLRKLRPEVQFEGADFFEEFEMRRPRGATSLDDLLSAEGGRLSLAFKKRSHGHFKAVVVPLRDGSGVLLNLSFGFSLVDAVRAYDLTAGDFAATDMAIEMLYLVEAKSAAFIESKKLNMRLQGAKIAAEEQAFTDTLTGLKNRRAMDHVLSRLIENRVPFGLLHLDLDFFKEVNDTFGHAAGDEVLQVVARILVHETRQSDIVARIGGDEFVMIFQRLVDLDRLSEISERIITRLEQPIAYKETYLGISGSIGYTTSFRTVFSSADELLAAADLALYASKHAGRGRATPAPAGHNDTD